MRCGAPLRVDPHQGNSRRQPRQGGRQRLGDGWRAAARRQDDDTDALRKCRWTFRLQPEPCDGNRSRSDDARSGCFELAHAECRADRAGFVQVGADVQMTRCKRYEDRECQRRDNAYQATERAIHGNRTPCRTTGGESVVQRPAQEIHACNDAVSDRLFTDPRQRSCWIGIIGPRQPHACRSPSSVRRASRHDLRP